MQINCHKVQLVVASCNMRKSSTNFDCRAAKRKERRGRVKVEERERNGERERLRVSGMV